MYCTHTTCRLQIFVIPYLKCQCTFIMTETLSSILYGYERWSDTVNKWEKLIDIYQPYVVSNCMAR